MNYKQSLQFNSTHGILRAVTIGDIFLQVCRQGCKSHSVFNNTAHINIVLRMRNIFSQQRKSIAYGTVIFYEDPSLQALQFLVSLDQHIHGQKKKCGVYAGSDSTQTPSFLTRKTSVRSVSCIMQYLFVYTGFKRGTEVINPQLREDRSYVRGNTVIKPKQCLQSRKCQPLRGRCVRK